MSVAVASWRRCGGRATSFLAMDVGSPEPRLGWVQNQGFFVRKKTVFSLYKGPITDKRVIAGLFDDSGEILDLFETN